MSDNKRFVEIKFSSDEDEYPDHFEGPFLWVEAIKGSLFAMREDSADPAEVAAINRDGSWDAGTDDAGGGPRKRRRYTRYCIYACGEKKTE
jgi:hypothetical protein